MKFTKTINITVFIVWCTLLSILLYKNYIGSTLERGHVLRDFFKKETYWYDIYRGSRKIGFAKTTFEQVGDEIIITHEREIKIRDGDDDKLLINKLTCLTDLFYSIQSFEYTSKFKDSPGIRVSGEVEEDAILIFHESPDKRWTKKISSKGRDFFLPVTIVPVIHQKLPVAGKPFIASMLNLVDISIDTVWIVLDEIVPIKTGFNISSLYKFKIGKSTIWTNERGIIVKEEPPSGITLYIQTKDIALNPEDMIIYDYTVTPYFKADTQIPDSENLNILKVKITGYSPDPLLFENSRVTFKRDTLTIKKETVDEIQQRTYTLPFTQEFLNEYLMPDDWVLSEYQPLQNTGRIYARAHDYDAFRLARYITFYVYTLIKTVPVFLLSDAETIHKSLFGDFLERTVMSATYLRAGGLPTRLVGGLVYIEGYFYFHTWPEVWFDQWVPVDPTLAQFPADVTHIPLKQGTLQEITSVIDDMRKLKIAVMEAS
jgi:hypothetical protein